MPGSDVLPACGHPAQDFVSIDCTVDGRPMVAAVADAAGCDMLGSGRLYGIVRQLPWSDGILCAGACVDDNILHRQIPQKSREGRKADSKGKRISGYDDLLCRRLAGLLPDQHHALCSGRSRPHRHTGLCRRHLRDAGDGTAAAKQSVRTRRRTFHLLRLHPRVEQVRRAYRMGEIPDNGAIFPWPVAAVRPLDPLPHQEQPSPDALLTMSK